MNAVAPVNVMPSSGGNTTPASHLDEPAAELRHERHIVHIHSLGPRVLAELLDEIAHRTGCPDIVADRIEAYADLDIEMVIAAGGDKFPPNVLGVVK